MFKGIEHLAIASEDPKRLADWYRTQLEFSIVYANDGAYFVEARNGALIEIIPASGDRPECKMKTPGIRHIAIAVDDFEAALAHLQEKNVQFLGEPYENEGNRIIFLADADGNILHLIQRARPLRP